MENMPYIDLIIFLILLLGMLLFLEVGRRLGARREINEFRRARHGISLMEGAVFTLMGLLISFSFYSANIRFDFRRQLIIQEVNAINTAYFRIDLLPAEQQEPMRDNFRHYVDARIAVYSKLATLKSINAEISEANRWQTIIWNQALQSLSQTSSNPPKLLLLPALNTMFDIANSRSKVVTFHMPWAIMSLLVVLAFVSAILAGYDMSISKKYSTVHMFGFILILVVTISIILDFEFPHTGLINLEPHDNSLVDLRQSMGESK